MAKIYAKNKKPRFGGKLPNHGFNHENVNNYYEFSGITLNK